MGWILIGILSTIIQLGVIVGIVVLIVKLVSGKGKDKQKTTSESAGTMARRLFVYSIMITMLILVGIGIAGLIDAALPRSGQIVDSSAAALPIAFVVVGLPVYLGLARYTLKRFATDPTEQTSAGWAFYLTVALIGSLLTTMALAGDTLSSVVEGDGVDRTTVIHLIIWGGIWVGHWIASQRWKSERSTSLHLLLGSAAGLIWAFSGAIATLTAVFSTVYDELFLDTLTGATIDDLLRPAMILVVGLPVWWWYWTRHARTVDRTPLWHAYVLLLGVLGGAVSVIIGAGIVLFSVLVWFLGNDGGSASGHFSMLPGALAAIAAGGVVWMYHGRILGGRTERERTEVDRVYDYLLAAAGLLVAAGGLTTLLVTILKSIYGGPGITDSGGEILATAITLLVVGAPLWWNYWRTIQRYRTDDAPSELGSATRRIYIVGLFGIAAITAVITLIIIVFVFFEDLLESSFGKNTIDSSSAAIALLLTAAAVAWYHFTVFREDRAEELPEPEPVVEEAEPGVDIVPEGALEAAIHALNAGGKGQVLVTSTDDGFRVEPTET
ncbi:MAG: DUF5671 domain-containing protein [Actinomycetota bacterium]